MSRFFRGFNLVDLSALNRVDGEAAAWELTWVCVGVAVAATLLCEFLIRRPSGGGRS